MPTIKTRETVKDVKVIDKAKVASAHMRKAFVRTKDQAENLMDDGQVSPSEYAEDKIRYAAEDALQETGHSVSSGTKKMLSKGRESLCHKKAVEKAEPSFKKQMIKHIRGAPNRTVKTARSAEKTVKQTAKSAGKASVKTAKGTVKTTQKTVKTAQQTSKAAVKTAQVTAKAAQKTAQASARAARAAAQTAKMAAKAAAATAKVTAKAIAASIKAILAGIKALIAAITAGGGVVLVIVIVICLIGMIVGYFFLGENTGGDQTMSQVAQEISAMQSDW